MATKRMQKNLTVMFTDISGFTKHTETISRDDLMSRLDTHNELLMPVIAHFDGKIVKTIGDAFLITFESPTNAVQCGLFMQHTLAKWNADKDSATQIHIKVSINSGEVTVTETDVFGDPVNVAAKIEKATNPDEIYFTEAVFLAMVKAEVPTTFVKTFRPKGAESQEIKLYRVAQEEDNERYQKIIEGTHIDKEKTKTRVLELSNVAEREFNRYQDTMDELVKAQDKGSRGVIAAVIGAALVLAVAIIVGFSMFKATDEQRVIDAANAFLANDKPEDAREQLLNFITDNGDSDAISQALESVRTYEINHATESAIEFMNAGRPADAVVALEAALKKKKPEQRQQKLLDRSKAFVAALEYMKNGDATAALESAKKAESSASPNEHIDRVIKQSKIFSTVRVVLDNEDASREQAPSLIDQLTNAFGNDTDNLPALAALKELLVIHLYWTARSDAKTRVQATELLNEYRKRFPRIPDWTKMSRAVSLGGLWDFLASHQEKRKWLRFEDSMGYSPLVTELRGYGKDDTEFYFEFVCELYEVHQSMHDTRTPAMWELGRLLKVEQVFIKRDSKKMIDMCRVWLTRADEGDSTVRSLVREHYYSDLRELLQGSLNATREFSGEIKIHITPRMNSFVLCSERGDLGAIADPFEYLVENIGWLVTKKWESDSHRNIPQIERSHVQALVAMTMDEQTYKDMHKWLTDALQDQADGVGIGILRRTNAKNNLPSVLEDLEAAHPQYVSSNE